jgi:archaellum component FlaG (FlaF/FlaG flagellin family)
MIAAFTLSIVSCNKEVTNTKADLIQSKLVNKTWYLDYAITGSVTKTFVGQSTYFITFLNDGSTSDSDGLTGTYSIVNNKGKYELSVKTKTINGNNFNYTHLIESVGDEKMINSYIADGQSVKTILYFTSK